jgi:hypothetical protein
MRRPQRILCSPNVAKAISQILPGVVIHVDGKITSDSYYVVTAADEDTHMAEAIDWYLEHR